MSKKYINNDYTLNIFAKNIEDEKALITKEVTVQQTRTVEQEVVVGYDSTSFIESTGSVQGSSGNYSYANMIFATGAADGTTPSVTNRVFTHPKIDRIRTVKGIFSGAGIVVSGSTMAVGCGYAAGDDPIESGDTNAFGGVGVVIFNSTTASNWYFEGIAFPEQAKYPGFENAVPKPEYMCNNFDLDSGYLAISAPGGSSVPNLGKILIYKSGSSGWAYDATISSSSFGHPPTGSSGGTVYWNDSAATSAGQHSHYTHIAGGPGILSCARLHKNRLIAGGVAMNHRFPNLSNNAVTYQGITVFNSSSASGWQFERFVTASLDHPTLSDCNTVSFKRFGASTSNGGGLDNNLKLNYDGKRVIAGAIGGFRNSSFVAKNGRVVIWNSSSASGWYEETQIDLKSAGFTNAVDASVYNYYQFNFPGIGATLGNPQEFKLYEQFGQFSCDISGSYFIASARGQRTVADSDKPHISNRIFVFESSSANGWQHKQSIDSPNLNTSGSTHANCYHDDFGYRLTFNKDVPGYFVTSAPRWRRNNHASSNSHQVGRVHVYKSSSASGWALHQSIDNPYAHSPVTSSSGVSNYKTYAEDTDYTIYRSTPIGFNQNVLAVPFHSITTQENNSNPRYGAIQILSGAIAEKKEMQDVEITESVQKTVTTSSATNFSPFIKAVRGPMNIRLQSGSSTPFSAEFGGSKNPA